MKRINFIKTCIASTGLLLMPKPSFSKPVNDEVISLEEIKDFVFAAHKDLEKTKMMVEQNPLILNCTNQFKKGDFETALGGASHMGRKDIAEMLVARGARMDIFNLTFLGYTDLAKTIITHNPQYLKAPGPHGFTLLHHANVGKHQAFADWLMEQGLEETRFKDAF